MIISHLEWFRFIWTAFAWLCNHLFLHSFFCECVWHHWLFFCVLVSLCLVFLFRNLSLELCLFFSLSHSLSHFNSLSFALFRSLSLSFALILSHSLSFALLRSYPFSMSFSLVIFHKNGFVSDVSKKSGFDCIPIKTSKV